MTSLNRAIWKLNLRAHTVLMPVEFTQKWAARKRELPQLGETTLTTAVTTPRLRQGIVVRHNGVIYDILSVNPDKSLNMKSRGIYGSYKKLVSPDQVEVIDASGVQSDAPEPEAPPITPVVEVRTKEESNVIAALKAEKAHTPVSLMKLDDARRYLSEVRGMDDVKALRDKAEAMRVYAKQAKLGLEAQNYAAEIKLRAERRAGELLADMPKNEGARGNPNGRGAPIVPSNDTSAHSPTLAEIGISYDQSSNWQKIAKLPEATFEAQIETAKADGEELTTAGMLRVIDRETGEITGRHKPKTNYASADDEADPRDQCQTPSYGLVPLLPFLKPEWTIWEPAAGKGRLVEALSAHVAKVFATDILTGQDFMTCEVPDCDVIITNPPYSRKYDWLERCYQLGKPFALLIPGESLYTESGASLFAQHGIEIIVSYPRIDFDMPLVGFNGGGAQFPAAWFTWGMRLDRALTFVNISQEKEAFKDALKKALEDDR